MRTIAFIWLVFSEVLPRYDHTRCRAGPPAAQACRAPD